MSDLSRRQVTQRAVRPALITVIAGLELAAAAWDGRIFLHSNSVYPAFSGNVFGVLSLLPWLLAFAAIYAGVGLLQMRRSAWTVWMIRHAWLASCYLLSVPNLLWRSTFMPGLTLQLEWRLAIAIFSVVAGLYLFAIRGQFTDRTGR